MEIKSLINLKICGVQNSNINFNLKNLQHKDKLNQRNKKEKKIQDY